MALLDWRPAKRADVCALQTFSCTGDAKRRRTLEGWVYEHPAEYEYAVQKYIRGLCPPLEPGRHLWLGWDNEGLGAAIVYNEERGHSDVMLQYGAVALRHRGKGGGVADEMIRVVLDEITSRAVSAGIRLTVVTAHIREDNRPSQEAARRTGMRHLESFDRYQVWQMRLRHPEEVLDLELPDE